jgi:hypothetical protein
MFEGFNRAFYDTSVWSLNVPSDTTANGNVQWSFGSFRTGNALVLSASNAPQAHATATFPGTHTNRVFIGFCGNYQTLYTDSTGNDQKYFTLFNDSDNEVCTIELAGHDGDTSKLTLLFKSGGTTFAEFYVPNTIGTIYQTWNSASKYMASTFLNSGHSYFEFNFYQDGVGGGDVSVRINGADLLTSTGATTAAMTTTNIKKWRFHSIKHNQLNYDDFYVVNATPAAAEPVSWLGYETRVYSPGASSFLNDTTPSGWTSADYYWYLDSDDGDSTTIFASTAAWADYSFNAVLTDYTVAGARFSVKARKEGTAAEIKLRYRSDNPTAPDDAPSQDLSNTITLGLGSYQRTWTQFFGLRPDGTAWETADFSNVSGRGFGVKYV